MSDWYQPKPKPEKVPLSRGECWTKNISKPVFLGSPLAVKVITSFWAPVTKRLVMVIWACAFWMAGQAKGPHNRPGFTCSWNVQIAFVHSLWDPPCGGATACVAGDW